MVPACGPLVPKDCSVEATGLREVYWVGQKILLGLSVGCNGKPPTNFLANLTRPLLLSEFISCKHADESYSQDSFSLACAKLLLMPLAYPGSKSKNICMFFLLYIFELIEKIIQREYYFCSLKKKNKGRCVKSSTFGRWVWSRLRISLLQKILKILETPGREEVGSWCLHLRVIP